jgi:hypothetical protein
LTTPPQGFLARNFCWHPIGSGVPFSFPNGFVEIALLRPIGPRKAIDLWTDHAAVLQQTGGIRMQGQECVCVGMRSSKRDCVITAGSWSNAFNIPSRTSRKTSITFTSNSSHCLDDFDAVSFNRCGSAATLPQQLNSKRRDTRYARNHRHFPVKENIQIHAVARFPSI